MSLIQSDMERKPRCVRRIAHKAISTTRSTRIGTRRKITANVARAIERQKSAKEEKERRHDDTARAERHPHRADAGRT
jgi:hypothetical protein